MEKTLVIYGSFGLRGLEKAVPDWSHAVILEMDALVTPKVVQCGARVIPREPMMDHARAEDEYARVRMLLDSFLRERCTHPGIDTSRRFLAACLGADCLKIVTPYLWNLDMAARLMREEKWGKIVVSPGTGICTLSWRQMAEALDIPYVQLPLDRDKPPFVWMLERRWQKWRARSRKGAAAQGAVKNPGLENAATDSPWVCADVRLETLLGAPGTDGGGSPWRKLSPLEQPSAQALESARGAYLAWWDQWWKDWKADPKNQSAMAEERILETLGQRLCRDVFPLRFLLLQQARERLAGVHAKAMMFGAMRGKVELMWLLAARERGIPTGACTLDDHVDPLIAFDVDRVFCDDERQREMALHAGMDAGRITMIRTHRAPALQTPRREALPAGKRGLVVLAGTFFSGQRIGALPTVNLWSAELLVETARLLPDHDFCFKPHPVRERPAEATHWTGFHHLHVWQLDSFVRGLRPPPNFRLLPPEENLGDLMKKTDVLLNIESYAAFEAYALGIPVVHVCPSLRGWGAFERLVELGAEQVADTPRSLAGCLKKNLHDAAHIGRQTELQQEFLRGFYSLEGLPLAGAALEAFAHPAVQATKP